jgi:hypothetical protein
MDKDDGQRTKADLRVTAYKLAASIFCRKMGVNPDQLIQAPHPTIAGVVVNIPFWYTIAGSMLELAAMLRSMKEAQDMQAAAANDGHKE